MKKKDKNVAGILALFFGWFGAHRYYLGEDSKGLTYTIGSGFIIWGGWIRFLLIPFMLIACMVDAITLFAMDEKVFDEKYNGVPRETRRRPREDRPTEQQGQWDAHRKRTQYQNTPKHNKPVSSQNAFKKSGIEKFTDYDYAGAIVDFKKSLEVAPNDIATHFNLACSYSLTEKADLAFHHLERAAALGFKDFDKIKNHHALAYLRIQPEFDHFVENGYKLRQKTAAPEKQQADILQTQPDLLDQLKKLGELRQQGLLTELEFEQQKKKLIG